MVRGEGNTSLGDDSVAWSHGVLGMTFIQGNKRRTARQGKGLCLICALYVCLVDRELVSAGCTYMWCLFLSAIVLSEQS